VDEHEKNNVIGEFLAKIMLLFIAWCAVAVLGGIGLKALGDEGGNLHAKLAASAVVVWLYFQLDRWVADK
jgi:hypothetical protein